MLERFWFEVPFLSTLLELLGAVDKTLPFLEVLLEVNIRAFGYVANVFTLEWRTNDNSCTRYATRTYFIVLPWTLLTTNLGASKKETNQNLAIEEQLNQKIIDLGIEVRQERYYFYTRP